MLRNAFLLGSLLLPIGAVPYHAACIAFDSASKTVYISDPFEKDCAASIDACRREVMDKWTAFLRKEGFAQTTGASSRCEMYKEGSTPDESPKSRVRKWRDEEVAQAQAGQPRKYDKVVQTLFELD